MTMFMLIISCNIRLNWKFKSVFKDQNNNVLSSYGPKCQWVIKFMLKWKQVLKFRNQIEKLTFDMW